MREELLKVLENNKDALDLIKINDLMGLMTASELAELSSVLEELVNEYVVYKTKKDKYLLFKNCPGLKIGRLSVNKKGFGFVNLVNEDDIYIPSTGLNGAIHDDIVLCEVVRSGIKVEGNIIKVVKRDLKDLVGEVKLVDGKKILDLDDDKKDLTIELTKESTDTVVEGHKVLVKIIKQKNQKKYIGEVVKILGHKDDPGVDILSIAYKYGIYEEFDAAVTAELEDIPDHVLETEMVNRKDLSNEVIFTIDGDDTKDIDDAISIERIDGMYRLGVHIADVSHYVKENTALGDEAYERGTSSYLADTVIPMLPHTLSNGICSLNEGVLRLTMSCVMDIDTSGKVINYDIFQSVIKSKKKMTYKKVNDIIERNIVDPEYVEFKEKILLMKELADILRAMKVKRGYIDFDLDEAKAIQDESGKCIDIVKRSRESGEILIEDFMIAANECVATHISHMELPFIYRVHAEPKEEKIIDFVNLVKILGYKLSGKLNDLKPKNMQDLLTQLNEAPEFEILSSMLLRSMKKAEYSKDNVGHYGLASRDYTHFTSPIRRYPDLVVHRLLKTYLVDADMSMDTINYYDQALVQIAEHSSEREVAAVNAERDVMDMKMAEYMEDHIGEEFEGIIDTVTNFGFFVQLPNLIEGLVHVNNLKGDYFNYVPELLAMIGKTTKKIYRIGDKVKVKCIGAAKESATIDFEIVEKSAA